MKHFPVFVHKMCRIEHLRVLPVAWIAVKTIQIRSHQGTFWHMETVDCHVSLGFMEQA